MTASVAPNAAMEILTAPPAGRLDLTKHGYDPGDYPIPSTSCGLKITSKTGAVRPWPGNKNTKMMLHIQQGGSTIPSVGGEAGGGPPISPIQEIIPETVIPETVVATDSSTVPKTELIASRSFITDIDPTNKLTSKNFLLSREGVSMGQYIGGEPKCGGKVTEEQTNEYIKRATSFGQVTTILPPPKATVSAKPKPAMSCTEVLFYLPLAAMLFAPHTLTFRY
tara:strand:+ start:125 stop:793 length:669 start_codon:yes stop_codon:yes gene_type:complete